MKRSFYILFLAVFAAVITFNISSCKKDDDDAKTPKYRSAQDNALAEGIFGGVYGQVDRAARQDSLKMSDTIACPVLTITGSTYPFTFTLDYGTNCIGLDGRVRSGKVISVISAPYLDSMSTITSTFENYYETINNIDYHVTGTQVVQNLGKNTSGHPHYSVNVTNASITSTHGTITWTSQRHNEFIQGYNSWLNPFDDVYLITGSSSGNDINGDSFNVNIITPLRWQFGCRWIQAGAIEIINPGYPVITVDYGTGACDNIVTVTINGVSYTVMV